MELQTLLSVPMQMGEAEEQIRKIESPLIRGLLHWNRKRLDRVLLNAMIDALEEVGIKARDRIERLCRDEHSLTSAETSLLDDYYCSAADKTQQLVWLNRGIDKKYRPDAEYYRACWPESTFIFVDTAGCGAHLALTCRLPKPAPREKSIEIMLNGKPQVEITSGSAWSTWDINLPAEVVQEGLNEITVRWPMPEFDSDEALEKARLRLCERKFPDFYPVFGEIHSFTASSGQRVPADSLVHEAVVEVEA